MYYYILHTKNKTLKPFYSKEAIRSIKQANKIFNDDIIKVEVVNLFRYLRVKHFLRREK